MIDAGRPAPLGAHFDGEGVNFALFSGVAEAVELCLFDDDRRETQRLTLPGHADGIWNGYIPGCLPGIACTDRSIPRAACAAIRTSC